VTVIAAGLLKAATSGTLSLSQLTLVIALGTADALLLTLGLAKVERRGTKVHLRILLAIAVALGATVVAVSRGTAFLLLMPLITYAVLFLSSVGTTGVIAACTAVTVTAWMLGRPSAGELIRDLAIWIASLVFVLVVSRTVLLQRRARTQVE